MKLPKIVMGIFFLLAMQTNGFAKTDQSVEPADKYLLKVNDQKYSIELNKYLELPDARYLLTIAPNKKFNYGGVHFQYPRHYAFEANLNKDYQFWTLSGNDTKILIQNYKIIMEHESMAQMMTKSWGKENCRLGKCEMNVPNRTLNGTKVVITMKTTKISQEIYSFKNSTGSLILILQDNMSDSGSNSPEYNALKKMFSKMLRVDEG